MEGPFICVLPTELFSFLRPIKLNSLCGDLDFEFSQVRGDTELGVVPLLFNPFANYFYLSIPAGVYVFSPNSSKSFS